MNHKKKFRLQLVLGCFLVAPVLGYLIGRLYEHSLHLSDWISFSAGIGVPLYWVAVLCFLFYKHQKEKNSLYV